MRDWTFKLDEYAVINEKAKQYLPQHVGELVQIFELKTRGINDYTVKLRNGDFVFVKENELNKVTDEVVRIYHKILKGDWKAFHVPTNEEVTIVMIDLLHNQTEITHKDCSMEVVNANTLKLIENEVDIVLKVAKYNIGDTVIVQTNDVDYHNQVGVIEKVKAYSESFEYGLKVDGREYLLWFNETVLALYNHYNHENEGAIMVETTGYFEEKGYKLGKLVDEKQAAYGDSVTKASQLMKVFLQDYKTSEGYLIPEELLDHILLQVRIIDKQNRIFSNPKADKMNESPYDDISGYGLLGGRIQNK